MRTPSRAGQKWKWPLAVAAMLLVSCAPTEPTVRAPTVTLPTATPAPLPTPTVSRAQTGSTIQVELYEWSIATDPIELSPGAYTMRISNEGQKVHSLTISGPGVDR